MTREEPTEAQRDQAALWLAKRTGGSFSADDANKLDAWLNADQRHRRAFDELRVLYAQLEAPAKRIASIAPTRRKIAARLQPGWGWIIPPAAGMAMLCCIWWIEPSIIQNWQADIVTTQQVVTDITLPDGSLARLGADTALALDFKNGRRRVRLLRGEAYFEIRHGQAGTFTVVANDDEVRDIGTEFNVDLDTDQTEVTVSEGAVEVIGRNDKLPVMVRQGSEIAFADGHAGEVKPADTELALSWLTGRLVVQGARIKDVVRTLERHASGKIIVRGELATQEISGTFPLTDVQASLETIASAVDGTITRVPPVLTILH